MRTKENILAEVRAVVIQKPPRLSWRGCLETSSPPACPCIVRLQKSDGREAGRTRQFVDALNQKVIAQQACCNAIVQLRVHIRDPARVAILPCVRLRKKLEQELHIKICYSKEDL